MILRFVTIILLEATLGLQQAPQEMQIVLHEQWM